MARRSEEQWKDLKFKLSVGITLLVVVSAAVGLGPGLEPIFLKNARAHGTEPWAANRMYVIGRIEEATFRTEKAMDIYREIYIKYTGENESQLPGLDEVMAEMDYDDDSGKWFLAYWLADAYTYDGTTKEDGGNPRPILQKGDTPHPAVKKALLRLAEFLEDHEQYLKTRHLFRAIKYCFPGTEEAASAEKALLRDQLRSF